MTSSEEMSGLADRIGWRNEWTNRYDRWVFGLAALRMDGRPTGSITFFYYWMSKLFPYNFCRLCVPYSCVVDVF
jgi:hypothetical protein